MRIHRLLIPVLLAALSTGARAETLVIHEWGTFTAFQDETGHAIGGINVDDEPVPAFVHDAAPGRLATLSDLSPAFQKGWPAGDPRVTMRLETPVLYVHPGGPAPQTLDVRVDFHGGWLTQYYPDAIATIPGHRDVDGRFIFTPLTGDIVGTLRWPEVRIGGAQVAPPTTTAPVWLAPRRVDAAPLTVGTEGERYLFYRGIGHLDAPVRVVRDADGALAIHPAPEVRIDGYWLVDVRADGLLAFRALGGASGVAPIAAGADSFPADAYAPARRAELEGALRGGLIAGGLFADEAEALLGTWAASYFRAPGLRLFFLTPRTWTERVLPLTLSQPAVIERAMIGRIELISPAQRAQLAVIAAGPTSDTRWWSEFLASRVYDFSDPKQPVLRPQGMELLKQANREVGAFARLGLAVPRDYQAFLALGRFREALLGHVLAEHPAPGLAAFAKAYGLREESRVPR
jgi:hypothetical protein